MHVSRRRFLTLTGMAAAASLSGPRIALADPTVISSLPIVISSAGNYALAANHTINLATGAAIEIAVDNVSIDLAGFTIDNSSSGLSTAAAGVFAHGRKRIRVINGTLEGFHTAVHLQSGAGTSNQHILKDLSLVDFTGAGMCVAGDVLVLRGNTLDTSVRSTNFDIASCTTGTIGIIIKQCRRCLLVNNDVKLGNNGVGDVSFGAFWDGDSEDVIAIGNRFENADVGVLGFGPGGKIRDSVMINVSRHFAGFLQDLGNNT